MRGSHGALIRARQAVYVEDFREAAPVLDLGCGRGEFLALLGRRGSRRAGSMPTRTWSRSRGARGSTSSRRTRSRTSRRSRTARSAASSRRQLLEHLPPPALVRLLELAAQKLRPGGVLVAETINPLSPLALRNYFADLTHAQPLVPETLELLARQAGFAEVGEALPEPAGGAADGAGRPVLARNVRSAERAPLRARSTTRSSRAR